MMTKHQHPALLFERICYATDCNARVDDTRVFCDRHWKMLPYELREPVFDAYVPGQESDIDLLNVVFLKAAMTCVEFILLKERRR